MKKLILLAMVLVWFGMFATPKAEAGVFIGIGLPVVPVYPAYYPGYYGPYPYYYGGYYGHPYGYGYRGYYGHVYNGRIVHSHDSRAARGSVSDK